MSAERSEQEETKVTHVQSLPSDFTDVQSRNYDPQYISDISNKMQIPDKLHVVGYEAKVTKANDPKHGIISSMMVPDRLLVAGDNQHVGLREGLRQFDFEKMPTSELSYVGLITPPHTLTLEEQFPVVEDAEENVVVKRASTALTAVPNGIATTPYTPGISPNESLLLNEEDEAVLIRTHIAKLTRRVVALEQENQKRSQRDLIAYPIVLGYFLWKVFIWFFRSR